MELRLRSRALALSLFVFTLLAAVVAGGMGIPSPTSGRYAAMPTPEALAAPVAATDTIANDPASPLYGMSVRLRAGSYALRRFDNAGRQVAMRSVRFSAARLFRTLAAERTFGGSSYVKLTSGTWTGWWVPVEASVASAKVAYSGQVAVTLKAGTAVGKRFWGRVTTRKIIRIASATTYHATERAKFGAATYYLLNDGPLAGRWVNQSGMISGTSAQAGAPVAAPSPAPSASAPAPTATPPPATPKPTASPTPKPVAAPLSTWKTLVLVYRDTDVTFRRTNGTNYRLQAHIDNAMYDLVRQTLAQTVKSVSGWSAGMAAWDMTVLEVPHALTRLDEFGGGYWVGPIAAAQDLDEYAPAGRYDSVVIVWQARDSKGVEVPVGGWGLTIPGGSWSNDSGFTSVITPAAMWWWTESKLPEEVFVHEWLHQVIFFHQDAGRMALDLHAGRDYGYNDTDGTWRKWYSDVMQGKVWDGKRLIGLSAEIWAAGKPTAP